MMATVRSTRGVLSRKEGIIEHRATAYGRKLTKLTPKWGENFYILWLCAPRHPHANPPYVSPSYLQPDVSVSPNR